MFVLLPYNIKRVYIGKNGNVSIAIRPSRTRVPAVIIRKVRTGQSARRVVRPPVVRPVPPELQGLPVTLPVVLRARPVAVSVRRKGTRKRRVFKPPVLTPIRRYPFL